jgi:RHS repeat-associated protein
MLTYDGDSFAYDDNGNLVSMSNSCGTTNYSWNARNRLSAISGFDQTCQPLVAEFKYDALGRRIEKIVAEAIKHKGSNVTVTNGRAVKFLYDGLDIVQEIEDSTVVANYIRMPDIDMPLARVEPGGTVRYYQTDALGSVIALTDETGAVMTTYSYDAFGNVTATGEQSLNPFQFAGRENDETGLYYNRMRYYSPRLQRFISPDPISFFGGDINLYAYVGNNPLLFTDPMGMMKWCIEMLYDTKIRYDMFSVALNLASYFPALRIPYLIASVGVSTYSSITSVLAAADDNYGRRSIWDMTSSIASHIFGGFAQTARRSVFVSGVALAVDLATFECPDEATDEDAGCVKLQGAKDK